MSDKIEQAVSTISDAYGISSDALQSAILYAVGYGDDDRLVQLGAVQPFDTVPTAHDTVRKLTDESAEVFGAWERYRSARERVVAYTDPAMGVDGLRDASDALLFAETDLHDEIADVLQAVANLCAAIGVDDLRPAIRRCRERNERRDRLYA